MCKEELPRIEIFRPYFRDPQYDCGPQYSNRKGLAHIGFPVILRLPGQTHVCGDARRPSADEHALVGRNLACYEFLKIAVRCSLESLHECEASARAVRAPSRPSSSQRIARD